jgi:hypothetical protein
MRDAAPCCVRGCAEAALKAGMKIFVNAIFGILLSALMAFARLGEAPDQCQV